MRHLLAIAQLARLDSSLLGFLAIFVPLLTRTRDLGMSFRQSVPMLFVGVCTFICNDLDDLERDRINHPTRPLPANRIAPHTAATLYFASLAIALLATRALIDPVRAFWYYALLIFATSYGHVVERLPSLKAIYVAIAISIPVFIVATAFPEEPGLLAVAVAALLFSLGRELLMDLRDRQGDRPSILHAAGPLPVAAVAFGFQAMGIVTLARVAFGTRDLVVLSTLGLLLIGSAWLWFSRRQKVAIAVMKLPLFVGLYFLT